MTDQAVSGSPIQIHGTGLGNKLQTILNLVDLQPGDAPSYAACKILYAYHPLGAKIVDFPIQMAQSQKRKITVQEGPEERLTEAFNREWKKLGADKIIANVARQARMYGITSLALLTEGMEADVPVDFTKLAGKTIAFNVLDPLNTAGSLVMEQDPNAFNFQKVGQVAVAGKKYHPSRIITILNEDPLYIDYTVSAFGFVGRSVYQRGLYPLKSFLNTLLTDNMISLKAGVLIAKMKSPSSIINRAMQVVAGLKREMIKEAETNNVISIGTDEDIQSLNLQNLEGAYKLGRTNILENIASSCATPAKILLAETFAEGFGEGTEDAKHIAQFVEGVRDWMQVLYDFMDKIVRYRAWTPEFYKILQKDFPELYGSVEYTQAFYDWTNSFEAVWPSLIEEPESEKIKVNDVQLRAGIAMVEVLLPILDPDNKAKAIEWLCDNFNSMKLLFPNTLTLDFEALRNYVPEDATDGALTSSQPGGGAPAAPKAPAPPSPPKMSFGDSAAGKELASSLTRFLGPPK